MFYVQTRLKSIFHTCEVGQISISKTQYQIQLTVLICSVLMEDCAKGSDWYLYKKQKLVVDVYRC